MQQSININNLLLTEREGRTGEYWPEVVTVRTEHREVRTKTTEGQYSPTGNIKVYRLFQNKEKYISAFIRDAIVNSKTLIKLFLTHLHYVLLVITTQITCNSEKTIRCASVIEALTFRTKKSHGLEMSSLFIIVILRPYF